MDLWKEWCVKHEGEYDYDKENSCQAGKMPKVPRFHDEICWCDIMTYYLMHVADYKFFATIHPYKGEVYTRQNRASDKV